jgi:hypothetical protein
MTPVSQGPGWIEDIVEHYFTGAGRLHAVFDLDS